VVAASAGEDFNCVPLQSKENAAAEAAEAAAAALGAPRSKIQEQTLLDGGFD
jgi:hypothetical protein